jgi:hypothetical protein
VEAGTLEIGHEFFAFSGGSGVAGDAPRAIVEFEDSERLWLAVLDEPALDEPRRV